MVDNPDTSENDNSFRSALYDEYVSLGAEMHNVGGYEVPFRYSSEVAEHNVVREAVDVFGLSLMNITHVASGDVAVFLAHSLVSTTKPLASGRTKCIMIVQENGGRVRRSLHHG